MKRRLWNGTSKKITEGLKRMTEADIAVQRRPQRILVKNGRVAQVENIAHHADGDPMHTFLIERWGGAEIFGSEQFSWSCMGGPNHTNRGTFDDTTSHLRPFRQTQYAKLFALEFATACAIREAGFPEHDVEFAFTLHVDNILVKDWKVFRYDKWDRANDPSSAVTRIEREPDGSLKVSVGNPIQNIWGKIERLPGNVSVDGTVKMRYQLLFLIEEPSEFVLRKVGFKHEILNFV